MWDDVVVLAAATPLATVPRVDTRAAPLFNPPVDPGLWGELQAPTSSSRILRSMSAMLPPGYNAGHLG